MLVPQVNKGTELALVYSDDAVLERHHAHKTFQLLRDPDSAVLAHLPREDFAEV